MHRDLLQIWGIRLLLGYCLTIIFIQTKTEKSVINLNKAQTGFWQIVVITVAFFFLVVDRALLSRPCLAS